MEKISNGSLELAAPLIGFVLLLVFPNALPIGWLNGSSIGWWNGFTSGLLVKPMVRWSV